MSSRSISRSIESRRGSALIVVSAMIVVALAIASYAINVVYMEMTRTELQISTDLASRASWFRSRRSIQQCCLTWACQSTTVRYASS